MAEPTTQDVIDSLITNLAAEFAAAKSIVFNYRPVEFFEGQNIEILRSSLDTIVLSSGETSNRVNAWCLDEAQSEQSDEVRDSTARVTTARGVNILSTRIRMWHAYEFYQGSSIVASANIRAVRRKINTLPKLGLSLGTAPGVLGKAEFVIGHDKLQGSLFDVHPFQGVSAHVLQGSLVYHIREPLQAAA